MSLHLVIKRDDGEIESVEAEEVQITDSTGIVYRIADHPDRQGGIRIASRGEVTTLVAPNNVTCIIPALVASPYFV